MTELQRKNHERALANPRGDEVAHVLLYRAVKACAARGWADDGYAGDYLIGLCHSARMLLNMDSGRLDCGTLDTFYVALIISAGGTA